MNRLDEDKEEEKLFIDGLRARGELAEMGEAVKASHTHQITKDGKLIRVRFK